MNHLRSPLLHFLLLGGLLFAAQKLLPQSPGAITLSPAEIERLRQDWQRESGRAPTGPELVAALQSRVDEEILLREALRLKLDERDGVARRRLLQNMRFAFPDTQADEARLLHEAQRLGMNTRDRVVRQRLTELMRQRLEGAPALSDADIAGYVARHAARYGAPARTGFRQIFFSRDRRGAGRAAQVALAQLRSGRETGIAGDPFLLGERFAPASETEIAQRFGGSFAQALAQAPEAQWVGPLESPFGLHLVRIESRRAPLPPDLAAVRPQAAYAALAERESAVLRAALVQLRQRYRVQLAPERT